MKKIITSLFLLLSVIMWSQSIENDSIKKKNFVQLRSGEIYYFDSYIQKTRSFFGASKLKVSDVEFNLSDVEYYKTGTEFFASTSAVSGACTDLAERIDIGKINIYRSIETVYNAGAPMMGAGGNMTMGFGGGYSTREVYYYNKDSSPLKSMSYDNLAVDLANNQESMILLQTYKKAKSKEVLWYVIGGAAILGGALTAGGKTGNTTTQFNFETGGYETVDETYFKPVNFGIAVGGLIITAVNYWVNKDNKKYLRQAVYKYNE